MISVHSSVDGCVYPADGSCRERVLTNLIEQLERPVDFIGLVERLYAEGARTFIEVGPKRALSTFVSDILEGRAHAALYSNHPKEGGPNQLSRLLAQLAAMGFEIGGAARGHAAKAGLRRVARSGGVKQQEVVRTGDSQPTPARSSGPPHPRVVRSRGVAEAERSGAMGEEPILISGTAVGLPGRMYRVFSDEGIERVLSGQNLIDVLPDEVQDRIVEKQVDRLVKSETGEARFERISGRGGSIKLAG